MQNTSTRELHQHDGADFHIVLWLNMATCYCRTQLRQAGPWTQSSCTRASARPASRSFKTRMAASTASPRATWTAATRRVASARAPSLAPAVRAPLVLLHVYFVPLLLGWPQHQQSTCQTAGLPCVLGCVHVRRKHSCLTDHHCHTQQPSRVVLGWWSVLGHAGGAERGG